MIARMSVAQALGSWRRLPRGLSLAFARATRLGSEPVESGAGVEGDALAGVAHPTQGAQPFGDYDAFIREHQRAILNYLWRMTSDEQSAYDLTQEVFVRAWRHFERLRDYDSPRAWLFRVASNLAISSMRGRRALSSVDRLPSEQQPAASDPAWRVVERDLVRAALDALPARRRAALILREVYGLSCAEVARALGMSEAAARMTLSRAREQFRAAYLREGQEGQERPEGGDSHDA